MTALRRNLGLFVAISTLTFSAHADLQSDFDSGVRALRRGNTEEALKIFQGILADDPSNEAAYQLFKQADDQAWIEVLMAGGQFELIGKRLMGLADVGRVERRNDGDAIKALVRQVTSEDVIERKRAVLTLSSEHGEYATPYLLRGVSNQDDDEKRVLSIGALTQMSGDVVPPLVAALRSEDAFTRRNVAYTLGYIADPRAAGSLQLLADSDSDSGVREAALDAASRCGGNGNALAMLLELGDAYHHRRDSALRASYYSDVTWSIEGGVLVPRDVPRFLYHDEMALAAYSGALMAAPDSLDAQAGYVRSCVSEAANLDAFEMAGTLDSMDNADGLRAHVANLAVRASAMSTASMDRALSWAVAQDDATAAIALCRLMGSVASSSTPGMRAAFASKDGAVSGEAAVALGEMAVRTGQAADGVVGVLGEAAGRDILRIAAVIDSDMGRANSVSASLTEAGMLVNSWNKGATAIATLRRVPGVDVILIADTLSDLTTNQVLSEVRNDQRFKNTPVFILASDADAATEMYGDSVTGAMSGADVGAVLEALGADESADRKAADVLSQRAAATLARLATGGRTNMSGAVGALAGTLAMRPDEVVLPAMSALGSSAGTDVIGALAAVLGDDSRSEAARTAAGQAMSDILARAGGSSDSAVAATLVGVMGSDASVAVRTAAGSALGRMNLDASVLSGLTAGSR